MRRRNKRIASQYKLLISKLWRPVLLLLGNVMVGVSGYAFFEGYSLIDALYMTIITVSTVGYGEVHALSDSGKLFTIFLIITNIGIFTYAISLITVYILEVNFLFNFGVRRMKRDIDKLNHHVIVCGYGRNGKEACEVLRRNNVPFLVVEKDRKWEEAMREDKVLYIIEDATKDHVLEEANITKARSLITTLPEDAENVFVVLTAREINPEMLVISRATNSSSVNKLKKAGTNNVIMPDKIGGAHMASLVVNPDVNEFIDIISGQSGNSVRIEEIDLAEKMEGVVGQTLKDLQLREKCGVNVLGVRKASSTYQVNPTATYLYEEGDKLIILGTQEQFSLLYSLFN